MQTKHREPVCTSTCNQNGARPAPGEGLPSARTGRTGPGRKLRAGHGAGSVYCDLGHLRTQPSAAESDRNMKGVREREKEEGRGREGGRKKDECPVNLAGLGLGRDFGPGGRWGSSQGAPRCPAINTPGAKQRREKASTWLSTTTMSLRVPVPRERKFYWNGCPHFTDEEAEAWAGGRGDPRLHICRGGRAKALCPSG